LTQSVLRRKPCLPIGHFIKIQIREGYVMNLRTRAALCAIVLAGFSAFPGTGSARGIRTDSGNWTLYTAAIPSPAAAVEFAGGGGANPGIGATTPVWISTTPFLGQQDDSQLFNIDQSNSYIYSWTTWSAPYNVGDVTCQNPLSNCAKTPIVAQVGVYALLGNPSATDLAGNPIDGDTEVVFNYAGACPNGAQLTMFGQTYRFSAASGAQCGYSGSYSNDFLFVAGGGVESIVDVGDSTQLVAGLPTGWTPEVSSVPEPSILLLFGVGLAALALRRTAKAAAVPALRH
jgi:hypothetical protein